MGGGTYVHLSFIYRCPLSKVQSASKERGKRGVSLDKFWMARSTRGSVEEENWI